MSWSSSPDRGGGAQSPARVPPTEHYPSGQTVAAIVIAVALAAYASAATLPAWETDTWVLNLLAQRTLHAHSWSDALGASRFILDNPKGWSDVFILASWFAIYGAVGANVAAFHLFGIACHASASVLLSRLAARVSGSQRVALWTGTIFALLPLSHDVVAVEAHSQYPLFGVLFLGAWCLLARWRDHGNRAALAGAVGLYALALGTKELAFALPPALLLELAAARADRETTPASLVRAGIGLGLIAAVAAPFLARPFWVALVSPERATSPADAAMLRDLLQFLTPRVLVPKLVTDLGQWTLIPFANEGGAMRWYPVNAAISLTAFALGVSSLVRDRGVSRWRLWRAALWLCLGYLPVGFQLDHSSFEKTGELYLAAMGMALAWGEILGSGTLLLRVRTLLGGALSLAMALHLQFLHQAMRAHGVRVQAAVRSLEAVLGTTRGPIVLVAEERLDRGAVDAVVLQVWHDLGSVPAPLAWIGGGGPMRDVATCPDQAWVLDASTATLLRWDDERHRFERLGDPAALAAALAWRDPDPERVWVRDACLVTGENRTVLTTELLTELSPATILPRL